MGLKIKVVLVMALAFLLHPGFSRAAEYQRGALRGLKGVGVLVEQLTPDSERLGMAKEQIKTDVELRLRKARIRVLTKEEAFKTPGKPYLYVNVNTFTYGNGLWAYKIKVELQEWVMLARGFETFGSIWGENDAEINIKKEDMKNKVRDKIGEEVDAFINDYLAANPK